MSELEIDNLVKSLEATYPKIQNLKQYLINVPSYHPEDPRYIPFWKSEMKKIIEGVWGEEIHDGKTYYRYCPGIIYFYGNYMTILDTDKKTKSRMVIKPFIRDIEWFRAYTYLEAQGFSGFDLDEEYSSDLRIIQNPKELEEYRYDETDSQNVKYSFNEKGMKKFVPVREAIYKLYDKPMGKPVYANEAKNICEIGTRGGGKQLPHSEIIITPNGFTTMGDLKIGDVVIGANGKPTNVTNKFYQGLDDVYSLELQDGRKVKCGKDHQWEVFRGKTKFVLTTQELIDKNIVTLRKDGKGKTYNFKIRNCEPVEYSEKDLSVDPYILGCLLGDGAIVGKTPRIASSDEFIINEFKRILGKDYELKYDKFTTNNHTIVYKGDDKWDIKKDKDGGRNQSNPLVSSIESLNLNKNCKEKFIPDLYKFGSIEQRLSLIQGLLDTDGSITKNGSIEFTNTNEKLLDDFIEVCRSLGIQCRKGVDDRSNKKHSIKGHICNRSITYRAYLRTDLPVFRLPRKLEKIKPLTYSNKVSIVNITKLDYKEDSSCITVDNEDSTYLTTDYVVTHNSYFYSGLLLALLLVDGVKEYNDEVIIKRKEGLLKSFSCIGSANSDKSSEFFTKISEALNQLAINNSLGAFNIENSNYPSPLFKQMRGDVKPGNKKNPYRHEYEVITNSGKQKKGTGSSIFHVSYSTNKQGGGSEEAAGGRYNISLIEEGGLTPNILDIWGSNKAVVRTDGGQFGSQIVIGTSGNMDLAKGLRKIFENPTDYECVAFENFYENKGLIGSFLPYFMTLSKFKDIDGNTDFKAALTYSLEQRNTLTTSEAIQKDKMNYPIFPSDMWITNTSTLFPVEEARQHLAELLKDESLKKYKRKFVKLEWNKNLDLNVEIIPHNKAKKIDTFRDSQGSNERKNRGTNSTECDIIIYEEPDYEALKLYPDLYTLIGHDPYVSDDLEGGESLGATYIMKSPKYKSLGVEGDYIVAELTAKFENRDEYYKVLEKLLHYYGNPKRGLMYENNRGDKVAEYFKKVNKEQLLALTPILYQDGKAKLTQILKYGFNMANQFDKLEALNMVAEFLNEVYVDNTGVAKKNIFRIDSLGLLDEIINYDFVAEKEKKANYDRISAIIGCMIARREQYNQLNDKVNIPREDDNVKKLKDNPMLKRYKTIFKNG